MIFVPYRYAHKEKEEEKDFLKVKETPNMLVSFASDFNIRSQERKKIKRLTLNCLKPYSEPSNQ